MRSLGIQMQVVCDKQTVIERLRKNREGHAAMVREARAGYVDKAMTALTQRLNELREGKIVSCAFSLQVPLDYTQVYDTALRMLDVHQGESVTLGADEFRHLMDDEWDWLTHFIGTNSQYSGSTQAYASSKGLDR